MISSILPESPRWLISKQRYSDAESLFRRIAEKNKKPFDETLYQNFVTEDRNVRWSTRDWLAVPILVCLHLQRADASAKQGNKCKAIFRSKVMAVIAINMSYQWYEELNWLLRPRTDSSSLN